LEAGVASQEEATYERSARHKHIIIIIVVIHIIIIIKSDV